MKAPHLVKTSVGPREYSEVVLRGRRDAFYAKVRELTEAWCGGQDGGAA